MIPWAGIAPRHTTQHNSHYVELCWTHNAPRPRRYRPLRTFRRHKAAGRCAKALTPPVHRPAAWSRYALLGGHKAAGRLASLASPQLRFDTHL